MTYSRYIFIHITVENVVSEFLWKLIFCSVNNKLHTHHRAAQSCGSVAWQVIFTRRVTHWTSFCCWLQPVSIKQALYLPHSEIRLCDCCVQWLWMFPPLCWNYPQIIRITRCIWDLLLTSKTLFSSWLTTHSQQLCSLLHLFNSLSVQIWLSGTLLTPCMALRRKFHLALKVLLCFKLSLNKSAKIVFDHRQTANWLKTVL